MPDLPGAASARMTRGALAVAKRRARVRRGRVATLIVHEDEHGRLTETTDVDNDEE